MKNLLHSARMILGKEAPRLRGAIIATSLVAVIWSLFRLYTGIFGFYHLMIQRPIHVMLAILLGLLLNPLVARGRYSTLSRRWQAMFNVLLPFLTIATMLYFLLQFNRMTSRIPFVDDVSSADVIFGVVGILLLLEVGRRVMGIALSLLAVLFIVYSFLGPYMPTLLRHRGIELERFIDYQFLTASGIWGTATEVSVSTVFYFVLFAAFLQQSGGGQLFIDLATVVTAKSRGGAAKGSIVASALMGTISGSSTANVVGTGIFTIPLMKRIGYPAPFAGAVEAVASTGGQLMPPILGAAAFIIAQFLGMPYSTVALAALIPAVLYYISLYILVDLKAQVEDLRGIEREVVENIRKSLWKRVHLLIPLVVLIYYIFAGFTLSTAAVRGIGVTILVGLLRKETRMGFRSIFEALIEGAKSAVTVAIPCALAGIVIGSLAQTGLSLKFTALIVELSAGTLILALIFAMLGQIILGMGMPTTAAYIMGAVLLVPTLVELGVSPLAAHFFVFYFGCLSMITPPVAISSYAAAGIAKAGTNETSWVALKLVLVAFLIPFAFVYNPALILEGGWAEIAWVTVTAFVGLFPFAAFILGYWQKRTLGVLERALTFVIAVLLITPERLTDLTGCVMLVGWLAASYWYIGRSSNQASIVNIEDKVVH